VKAVTGFDLIDFTILNASTSDVSCDIVVHIKDVSEGADIVQFKASQITLNSGINTIPFSSYQALFYYGKQALQFRSSQILGDGTYEICISILENQSESPFKHCEVITVKNFVEIHLVNPQHKEKIETLTPILQWYSTFDQDIDYRIHLCELFPYVKAEEALNQNLRLLDIKIIDRNYLYPFSAPALQYGKTYAWQIVGLDHGAVVGRSESWLFTPVEPEFNSDEIINCYRQINKNLNTGNYLFQDIIKFTYHNYAAEQNLSYSIIDLSSGKKLQRVPIIKLTSGLNKIDIPTKKIEGVKKGKSYTLEIRNKYNERYSLSFDMIK